MNTELPSQPEDLTPELAEAIRKMSEGMAAAMGPMKPTTVICRKPTPQEIAVHQAKLLFTGLASGIEPTFSPRYMRRVTG